jgi:hypothetical protein
VLEEAVRIVAGWVRSLKFPVGECMGSVGSRQLSRYRMYLLRDRLPTLDD